MKSLRLLVLFLIGFVLAEVSYAQVKPKQSRTMSGGGGQFDRVADYNSDQKVVGYGWPPAGMLPMGESLVQSVDLDMLGNAEIVDAKGCRLTVVQVLDKENAIVSFGKSAFWLSGGSTESLSNGSRLRLASPVMIDGKKEYLSVSGSKSIVKVISLLSLSEYNEKRATELTLNTGEKIKLIYKEPAKKGHVFEQLDGSTVTYTTDEFDEASQKIIKKMIDQARKAAKVKKK